MMESFFTGLSSKVGGTFKPNSRPQHKEGSRRQALHNYTRRTLGTGFIRQAVALPPGEDLREWMATNTVDFFNALTLLVGIVTDESQPRLDPGWGFPPGFEYLWVDPSSRKPIKCSGPQYIEHVLNWVDGVLNDEKVFPSSFPILSSVASAAGGSMTESEQQAAAAAAAAAARFPRDFEKTIKAIFKRLFRIFAILYTHHYQRMELMGAVAHLNTTFRHFIFFCFEFDLVPPAELEAIDALVERMHQEFIEQGGHVASTPTNTTSSPQPPNTPFSPETPHSVITSTPR